MLMRPDVGVISPRIMWIVVVLPAPFGSEQPDYLAALDSEAHVVDRAKIAEGLAQIFHFYQHRFTCLQRASVFRPAKKQNGHGVLAPVAV